MGYLYMGIWVISIWEGFHLLRMLNTQSTPKPPNLKKLSICKGSHTLGMLNTQIVGLEKALYM